jgi:hypothetical protein
MPSLRFPKNHVDKKGPLKRGLKRRKELVDQAWLTKLLRVCSLHPLGVFITTIQSAESQTTHSQECQLRRCYLFQLAWGVN